MSLTPRARKRLAGLWGSYDFSLIRDRHFLTAADLTERFLERYETIWPQSTEPTDTELLRKRSAVRTLLMEWAERKLVRIIEENSAETIRAHIMFKQLHYGPGQAINFGSIGTNWKTKAEIAQELALYRPWSVKHVAAVLGGTLNQAYQHMGRIVERSGSPSENYFFDSWWGLTSNPDRPMLFPQVQGHTSGKFWHKISDEEVVPIHFDFGLVNVVKRTKVVIECDSRRYHSHDVRYQADRDRQNIAEREGWSVRRFTYEDIMRRINRCFENLEEDLSYS